MVDNLNLENISVIPAADKGTERNQGLVDSLLLEDQHTSRSKDVEPKINQVGAIRWGRAFLLYPPN